MDFTKEEAEQQLVRRLYARDEAAMTLFYTKYQSALRATIWRIVHHRELAEDVLQEAMLKFWLAFPTYDPRKSGLYTWALHIAQHVAIDRLRQQRRLNARTYSLESERTQLALLPASVAFRPEHIGVSQWLERLVPADRQLADLLYWQGYTQLEAAQVLQLPLGTVKSRSRRIIRSLGKWVRAPRLVNG